MAVLVQPLNYVATRLTEIREDPSKITVIEAVLVSGSALMLGDAAMFTVLGKSVITKHIHKTYLRSRVVNKQKSLLRHDIPLDTLRQDIKEKSVVLKEYRRNFDVNNPSFMLLSAAKGSGKTLCIKEAFGGDSGVLSFKSTLKAGETPHLKEELKEVFKEVLENYKGENLTNLLRSAQWMAASPFQRYEWNDVRICWNIIAWVPWLLGWRLVDSKNLVIVWNVSTKEGGGEESHTYKNLNSIAGVVAGHARNISCDSDDLNVPIVIETSNHVLASMIPKPHAFCDVIYMDHMNYNEFMKAFEADPDVKQNEKAWKELLGGEDKYKDTLYDYCSKFGGNLRELKRNFLKGSSTPAEYQEKIEREYKNMTEQLQHLTEEQKKLLKELVNAGPTGKTIIDEQAIEKELWKDLVSNTLRQTRAGRTKMNRMAHVHHLLGGNVEEMVRYGWIVKKDVKAKSA